MCLFFRQQVGIGGFYTVFMSFCQEKRRRHEAENSAQFIEQAKSDAQTQQSKLQEVPGFKKGSLKTSLFAFFFQEFSALEKI